MFYQQLLPFWQIQYHLLANGNSIDDLYSYIRLDTINQLNEDVGLERIQIIAADGPSDYMRPILNKMDDETFELFIKYHLATCERQELIGASSHTIDILKK